ncbi:MAG: hypothetical protein KQH57_04655 [Actinomycetales bacterium]|nr:hypothetical protein [Actinomycetales bacterium]
MSTHLARRIASAAGGLVLMLGVAVPAAGAATVTPPPAATITTPAAATPAMVSDWTWYEGPFSSYSKCEARAAYIRHVYGGTHYGAIVDTKCAAVYLPYTCPPKIGISLLVKSITGVGGGGGGTWSIRPKSFVPAATVC